MVWHLQLAAAGVLACLSFLACETTSTDQARTVAADTAAEAAARKTITDFYDALERQDAPRACALMTEANRREAESFKGPRDTPCADFVADLATPGYHERVGTVRVRGNKATAHVTTAGPNVDPEARSGSAELIKRDNRWQVAAY